MRRIGRLIALTIAGMLAGPAIATGGSPESCSDRRIVRFGETTKSIAARCGVTPGSIERQNPGLHIKGATQGTRINVPKPAVPSPRIEIRGSRTISGAGAGVPTLR